VCFKVYGEGEWKVRQHGWSNGARGANCTWGWTKPRARLSAAVASEAGVSDDDALPDIVAQVEGEIRQVSADGL